MSKGSVLDIHCHILLGLDDGSGSMQDAIEMAQIAQFSGVCGLLPHRFIQVEPSTLEVRIHDGADKLLKGVTAFDEKDEDLRSKVLIESVSQFAEDGSCTVTYAVADADKHVAKNTRRIYYTDYISPHFIVNQALVFPVGTTLKISSLIGALDCIDGDISDKVLMTATNYQATSVGVFGLSLQVGDSKGDTVYLNLPVYVEERS